VGAGQKGKKIWQRLVRKPGALSQFSDRYRLSGSDAYCVN